MAKTVQKNSMIKNVEDNIRAISAQKRKTADEMAASLCFSRKTWYNRMNNPGTFTLYEIVAISRILGTTPETLMQPIFSKMEIAHG